MKSPRILIALCLLLLTACWRTWDHVHMYPAAPETQSAFFKSYSPQKVLDRFSNGLMASGGGRGDTTGYDSVAHEATFQGNFGLCSDKFMPLMDALRNDVAAQLVENGAEILSQIGVAEAGFHFDYRIRKTLGSVTIAPLQLVPDLNSSKNPRPNCMVDIQTRIDVAEKWFAKEPMPGQIGANGFNR